MSAVRKISDEQILTALAESNNVRSNAAISLGMPMRTFENRILSLRSKGLVKPLHNAPLEVKSQKKLGDIHIPTLPDGSIDIRTLIDRRKAAFTRKDEAAQARKLIGVKVKSSDPIGICLIGDPHLDDDGTDLAALERDMVAIKRTDGLYAACIGDIQNNWVGRLSHLWAHQETTASQAWQLVEWFVNELKDHWMFMVQGNHDHWSGAGDPLRWIQRQANVALTGDHAVRLALRFPSDVEVRIAARHDWPGGSMWNPTHGQLKAAHMAHHDHVIVSGHRHTGGYQMMRIPSTGMLTHLMQLGSYKTHDEYAERLALLPRLISPSATIIIDPTANELGLVKVIHDTEAAADYLTWLRSRKVK